MKRSICMLVLICAFPLMAAAQNPPDVRANVSEVTDNRTTGQFFAGLSIELDLLGSDVQDAKAYRFIVEKAVDDLGTDLVKDEEKEPELQEISAFGNSGGPMTISVDLKNPPRKAQYVKELSGTLELFAPKKDPDSLAWIQNAQDKMGSALESPKLEKAGVKILLLTKEQYEEKKKEEEKNAAEKAGGELGEAFAETYGIRILLATQKALARVPVTVKDIALP